MREISFETRNKDGESVTKTGVLLWEPRELHSRAKAYARDDYTFWVAFPDGSIFLYLYPRDMSNLKYTGTEVFYGKALPFNAWRKKENALS